MIVVFSYEKYFEEMKNINKIRSEEKNKLINNKYYEIQH